MSMLLSLTVSIAVLAAVVFAVINFLKRVNDFRKFAAQLNKFPQNPKNPIMGHLLQYPGTDEEGLRYQREMTAKFPVVSVAWMGPFLPLFMVTSPETVKAILRTSEPKAAAIYNLIRPWVGDGLLLSSGEKWARNRRLLTPAFHFDILKPYVTLKNRAADVFLDKMEKFYKRNEYFEVFTEVSLFTLDVILKCAFSYETDCQNIGTKHPYVNAVNKLSSLSTERFFKPWLHSWIYFLTPNGRTYKKNCDFVHKVAEDIIDKRRKALASGTVERDMKKNKRCKDFLDILLTAKDENGTGLSAQEIRDETDTFLFEGHDTTASALSWTMFSLAEHPECQEKVYREVEELMATKKDTDIQIEDLPKLSYLTMCLKEAMRLHSPVPFIQRQLTQDMQIDGQTVPKGTIITIVIYNIHHNPTVWPDSLEFQPERFSPENVERRDPFAFVPFSAGPRNCIGQNFAMHELKIILARMIHRFQLKLDPDHKVEKREDVVMRSENGIRMMALSRVDSR